MRKDDEVKNQENHIQYLQKSVDEQLADIYMIKRNNGNISGETMDLYLKALIVLKLEDVCNVLKPDIFTHKVDVPKDLIGNIEELKKVKT